MPRLPIATVISLALIVPASPNYALRQLDFGAGGGTGKSANYSFEGMVNEQGGPMSGTAYNGGLGFGFTQMSFVPQAPSVTNPGNYYNKLHVTIDPSGNPSDALYALAISSDGFATVSYIKADHGIGSSLTLNDYKPYAAWGGENGFDVLGLLPSTQYEVKVKAMHGDFTESGFGPTGSASTVNSQLSFDIDVSSNDTETTPPYISNLGTLLAGNVITGTDKIWVDVETNASSGATVYIAGQHNGLHSNSTSYTIPGVNGDLAGLSEGFGIRGDHATQSTGGPLVIASPYDTSNHVVGQVPTVFSRLLTSSTPVYGGRGSFLVKAKANTQTPAKGDYRELFTIIGSANFH